MDVHARLRSARIAPRKMRLVANTLRGMSVDQAEAHLKFLAPRSAGMLLKLLNSAVANAKQNFELDPKNLVVRDVTVGGGTTMKRIMARARGSAYRIEKRTSHVDLVLTEKTPSGKARAGKKSKVVSRKVEELSADELAQHRHDHDHDHDEAHESSGANTPTPSGAQKTARQFDRRGGEA